MAEVTDADTLITLLVPPDLETEVVDWLLAREDAPGFFSFTGGGHGEDPAMMTVSERVAGRRRTIAFEIACTASSAQALLDALKDAFEGTRIRYWTTPIGQSGRT